MNLAAMFRGQVIERGKRAIEAAKRGDKAEALRLACFAKMAEENLKRVLAA